MWEVVAWVHIACHVIEKVITEVQNAGKLKQPSGHVGKFKNSVEEN